MLSAKSDTYLVTSYLSSATTYVVVQILYVVADNIFDVNHVLYNVDIDYEVGHIYYVVNLYLLS